MLQVNQLIGFGAAKGGANTHAYWRIEVTERQVDPQYTNFHTVKWLESSVVVHPENFTSATNGDWTVSESDFFSGFDGYKAFDGNGSSSWLSATTGGTRSLTLANTVTPFLPDEISLTISNLADRGPKTFTAEYSDNGTDWTVYKSFSETGWTASETRILSLL